MFFMFFYMNLTKKKKCQSYLQTEHSFLKMIVVVLLKFFLFENILIIIIVVFLKFFLFKNILKNIFFKNYF
jgi:hypothetical protein